MPAFQFQPQEPHDRGASAEEPLRREGYGTFDPLLLSEVINPSFVASSGRLLDALGDQIAASGATSRLPIQLRYQVSLEMMQALVELYTRAPHARLEAVGRLFEHAHSIRPTGDLTVLSGQPFTSSSQEVAGAAWQRIKALPEGIAGPSSRKLTDGIILLPIFYAAPDFLDDHRITSEERTLLKRWYAPTLIQSRFLLLDRDALAARPADAAEIYKIIQRLSGHDPASLPGTLERFNGQVPLTPGPLRFQARDNQWFSFAKHPHLRIPFGALPASREFLVQLQSEIEAGHLAGHTVQIAGRVSLDFLKWARGQGVHDPGPIPDIEVLYAMGLPSGKLYKFPLKPARQYTQKVSLVREDLSKEDAQRVAAIEHYFKDPEHRRDLALLTNLRASDYPKDLQEVLATPWRVESFDQYQRLRLAWSESILIQLTESLETRRSLQAKANWLETNFQSREAFRAALLDRLAKLPDEQQFYPAEVFRLSPEQSREFLERFEQQLYQITEGERSRVEAETHNDAHKKRIALGYSGPREGFPLPLDYMIMDMIITMRRQEAFRTGRAKKIGGEREAVIVPDRIGRSYQNPERFWGVNDIADKLSKTTAAPSVVATILDPSAESGVLIIEGEEKIKKYFASFYGDNLARIIPSVARRARELKSAIKAGGDGPQVQRAKRLFEVFREFNRTARGDLRESMRELAQLQRERGQQLQALGSELKAQNVGGARYHTEMHKARAEHEKKCLPVEENIQRLHGHLISFYRDFDPSGARGLGQTLVSIVDQHIAKFPYSVGAQPIVVLDEEVLGAQGLMRRTHSEQLGGKNMYIGGELIFARWRELFTDYKRWLEFAQKRELNRPWYLHELNNMSGHYQPDPPGLQYAQNLIFPALIKQGISVQKADVVDRLSPGLRMRGVVPYRF